MTSSRSTAAPSLFPLTTPHGDAALAALAAAVAAAWVAAWRHRWSAP